MCLTMLGFGWTVAWPVCSPYGGEQGFLLQEVYGRIRLCRNMLADHFIPSYLGSLETALAYIETGCVNVDA